ncbi:hypothetical protein, partial [uncultured Duncaniella sp.]|uniref:hypothetical protein n=1 Tax=uncultured Duncaniella sp. TaxID=2768039 RepID=UPI00265A426A
PNGITKNKRHHKSTRTASPNAPNGITKNKRHHKSTRTASPNAPHGITKRPILHRRNNPDGIGKTAEGGDVIVAPPRPRNGCM